MAILTEQQTEISGGFSKTIDEGAQQIVFDLFQKSQYQFPIKSTVREVVSNGLDSITEKQIARQILSQQAKVEDYYIEREGEAYKDSKFDPHYYDLTYLHPKDEVVIIYKDAGEIGKDSVIIRDYGVGLGGSRLSGYFSIGYSSKRLASFALGKFGLGAKSPLSTNAPYYTMTSRYNGKEFQFNIYSMKFESTVPEFDMVTGTRNPEYELPGVLQNGKPAVVFYRKTDEYNMLEIEIPAKKHHKQQYIDAVTSQLLYFRNVKLFIQHVDNNDYMEEIKVQADIMYEDDMIVLSTNSPYKKPHIILNGVNYGYINFQELELEDKLGNIGIKVPSDKVSINPSRESLIWDDITREIVVKKFHDVVEIAEQTINQELQEKDFLKWLRIAAQASGNSSLWGSAADDSVIGRLSKIVDMSKVELTYPADKSIRFNSETLKGIDYRHVWLEHTREGNKTIKTVSYEPRWRDGITDGLPIIVQKGSTFNRKNKYILTHLYPQGYINLRFNTSFDLEKGITPEDIPEKLVEDCIDMRFSIKGVDVKDRREKIRERIANLYNYILQSADLIWYESIEVPENFKANESEHEVEEDVEQTEEVKESAAERRKLSGKTILHTPRIVWNDNDWNKTGKLYQMQKIETPVHVIDSWSNPETYWSNDNHEGLLHTASLITRYDKSFTGMRHVRWDSVEFKEWLTKGYTEIDTHEYNRCNNFYDNSDVRLLKVAQNNTKYYHDFKHITKFFKEIKNKTITMSNALIRWNTARLIDEKLDSLSFLNGFKGIDPQKAEQYKRLCKYVSDYWRSLDVNGKKTLGAENDTTKQLISHLDRVGEFQLFVRRHPDEKEAIVQLAQELFNPQQGVEIQDGRAIEIEIYDLYLELLDWATPVQTLMNIVKPLTDDDPLTNEQEEEIRHYFKYRNCPL